MLNIQRVFEKGRINSDNSVVNSSRVSFKQLPDKVELRSLDRFFTKSAIERMIETNPKIKNIVQRFTPELGLNMKELAELQQGHAKDTQNIAQKIIENLPYSMQHKIDKQALDEAAYLHDLGKVLIPKSVLNKPAKLTPEEYKIMSLHSELSYELLKSSNLSERTLNLIKNHHNTNSDFRKLFNRNSDYTLQILTTSDKYSALTENRIYKAAMTPQEALATIYRDVENGDLDQRIFMALANHIRKTSDDAVKTMN